LLVEHPAQPHTDSAGGLTFQGSELIHNR